MSALLMIQDNSVKCSDEMRNKPALLQYALGEDRPSLKHKTYQLYRLKDFSIGPCCILFSVLNERELLISSQGQQQVDNLHIFTVDSMQPARLDSK